MFFASPYCVTSDI